MPETGTSHTFARSSPPARPLWPLPLLKALGLALDPAAATEEQREYEAALADYDRAIELDPTDAVAYNNRAAANVSLGRINEARADLQQAVVLARESGNNDLAERLEDTLGHFGNNEVQ